MDDWAIDKEEPDFAVIGQVLAYNEAMRGAIGEGSSSGM
jgi:hypothetical protein